MVKSSPGEHDILKHCLQGEEVSLYAQGVCERVLRIGHIGQVIKDDEPLATDLCIRWLICEFPPRSCSNSFDHSHVAQLKTDLRLLWSLAAKVFHLWPSDMGILFGHASLTSCKQSPRQRRLVDFLSGWTRMWDRM